MGHKYCSRLVWIEITDFYCSLLTEPFRISSSFFGACVYLQGICLYLRITCSCGSFGNPSSSFLYSAVSTSGTVLNMAEFSLHSCCFLRSKWRHNIYPFCVFLPVEFDDCVGNEDVKFEVSDPSFHVDEDLNLVPEQDVLYSKPILFIHGLSAHADDMAQVDITGLPVQSPHFLRVSTNCYWCVRGVHGFLKICFFIDTSSKLRRLRFIKDGKGYSNVV